MPIELPHLDYSFDALEPHISSATLKAHHDKHHKAYVDKTNALIANTPLAGAPLEEVVRHAAQRRAHESAMTKLFNQAAQAWNHAFYWRSLRPPSKAKPQGAFGDAIRGTFGSQAQFEEALKTAATDQFASGWAGWCSTARVAHRHHQQRRHADRPWPAAAAGDRRVGARVLPRLSEKRPSTCKR
jgi:Fe-Mn family superoxide dismutase